jgi:hypothetical protein
VNVTVDVTGFAPVTDAGLGLAEQVACAGVNVTVDVTVHVSVTLPVYPFAEVTVTVAVDELPGLIAAGPAVPTDTE